MSLTTFCQKMKTGLRQLIAGSRRFNLSTLKRDDLMSLTEEATKVSGIAYVMDAYRDVAETEIDGKQITFIPLWKWLLQVGTGEVTR